MTKMMIKTMGVINAKLPLTGSVQSLETSQLAPLIVETLASPRMKFVMMETIQMAKDA